MSNTENTSVEMVGTDITDLAAAPQGNALLDMSSMDNILIMANKADKYIEALNKVMTAALKITSEYDWCLIGGKPYLQESGATKVARLFGISWEIANGYPKTAVDAEGYKTYSYKMRMYFNSQFIDCEGSRSMREDFFAKRTNGLLKPEEVDERDVRMAAYTNCIVNGIKRLIPNLRSIDVSALTAAGLEVGKIKGYDFNKGSKGGKGGNSKTTAATTEESNFKCTCCGKTITQKVAEYSQSKYGKPLCMDCQKKPTTTTDTVDIADEDMPF